MKADFTQTIEHWQTAILRILWWMVGFNYNIKNTQKYFDEWLDSIITLRTHTNQRTYRQLLNFGLKNNIILYQKSNIDLRYHSKTSFAVVIKNSAVL